VAGPALAAWLALAALAARPARADDTSTGEVIPHRGGSMRGRVGIVGAYRRLYDLTVLGAGGGLALGAEGDQGGGYVNLQYVRGRTLAGLDTGELELTGTAEALMGGGWRLGGGAGLSVFGVGRATTGGSITSLGLVGIARAGYDFGPRPGVFVLLQGDVHLLNGPAVWGPTLQVGWQF
jgi:hypothetical protein